jgi:Fur family ferric uptake transcriptional regulator
MTTKRIAQADAHRYIEQLRRLRLRLTPQRLAVLEALATQGGHMTAEAILQWAARRYPDISVTTIYRILEQLISAGLVAQTDFGGSAAYFELIGDSPHHHLVCNRCGAVIELDDAALAPMRELLLRDYGFQVHPRHLALFGTCRRCQAAAAGAALADER